MEDPPRGLLMFCQVTSKKISQVGLIGGRGVHPWRGGSLGDTAGSQPEVASLPACSAWRRALR